MQQMYGDDCLSRANVFVWRKRFLEGRESLECDNREGWPISPWTPEMIEKVRDFMTMVAMLRWNDKRIIGAYYLEVLKRLMARICRIRPEYRDPETWSLLHDNAPSQTSLIFYQFLARNQVCMLNHPQYSPDLAPCDFSLFL